MKFLESPAALLAAMALSIVVFGLGLTSPIWLIVGGRQPLEAIQAGTPIVLTTIVGLVISTVLGVAAYRLRKPRPEGGAAPAAEAAPRSETLVHVVVILMFLIPFLTILVGVLLHGAIDFAADR